MVAGHGAIPGTLLNMFWRLAALQLCSFAALQLCNFAALQLCSFAALQLFSFAALQLCSFAALRDGALSALQLCTAKLQSGKRWLVTLAGGFAALRNTSYQSKCKAARLQVCAVGRLWVCACNDVQSPRRLVRFAPLCKPLHFAALQLCNLAALQLCVQT